MQVDYRVYGFGKIRFDKIHTKYINQIDLRCLVFKVGEMTSNYQNFERIAPIQFELEGYIRFGTVKYNSFARYYF